MTRNPWIAVVVSAMLAPIASAQPRFFGLGDLPGGSIWSDANGVSADGRFVVGTAVDSLGYRAFLWSDLTGMAPLPDGPGGLVPGVGSVVAPDGRTVAGGSSTPVEPFRWTASGGTQAIGGLGGIETAVSDMSSDGSVLVGWGRIAIPGGPPGTRRAFRWTEATGIHDLGTITPDPWFVSASAVTGDGAVIYGYHRAAVPPPPGAYSGAFAWTERGGMQAFEPLTDVYDVSTDGTLFLGRPPTGGISLWSESGGYTSITTLETANAHASDSGDVVVFTSASHQGGFPYIWQTGPGYPWGSQILTAEFLADRFGLETDGWFIDSVRAVSADGTTIIGQGYNPMGLQEAWVAVIPEPGTLSLSALGLLVWIRRRSR